MKFLDDNTLVIGADETGVGDYFTPLVATAVFIPMENIAFLKTLNLDDSKKISDKKILELEPILKKYVYHQTSFLSQKIYNELNQIYNANELKMFLHLKNINYLQQKYNVENVIIDLFSTVNTIYKYQTKLVAQKAFNLIPIKGNLILETKAESKYLSVAVASILARAKLLNLMNEQNKKWNLIFPLGASSLVDAFGKRFIKSFGIDELKKVAKFTFKNTEKILNN
ncbi:ribonuclease HIII [Candidatus Mycoplasma pogonae]